MYQFSIILFFYLTRFVGYSDYITLDNIYKEIRISKDYEIKMLDNFKLQDCKQEKIYDIREKEKIS